MHGGSAVTPPLAETLRRERSIEFSNQPAQQLSATPCAAARQRPRRLRARGQFAGSGSAAGSGRMLSTLRARGAGATRPAQPVRWARRAPCTCSLLALGSRGPATAGGLARAYAGGTRLVAAAGRPTNVCSRAEVAALLRRWTSSKATSGSGSVKQAAPKLDGWLGMTALEVADAASDPWTALRMRVAVLVQLGCFLYILNNYGISSTLCQGPSMMPTLNPAGDVVLVPTPLHKPLCFATRLPVI